MLTNRGKQLSFAASDSTFVLPGKSSLSTKLPPEPLLPSRANRSPPPEPPTTSEIDCNLKLNPANQQKSSPSPSTASTFSLPTGDASRTPKLPFEGLVFGVIPTDWNEEVLLQAQRIIVVGN